MTAKTATKPKAAGKATAPAPKNAPAPVQPAPKAPRPNPAYADEATRAKVTQAMAQLGTQGFTRPAIADATGMSKGAVWRAQHDKVHSNEVPIVEDLIKRVLSGEVKPPTNAVTRVSATELQARVVHAVELLKSQGDAKSISALRKLVNDAVRALEDGAPAETPETDEPKKDEAAA